MNEYYICGRKQLICDGVSELLLMEACDVEIRPPFLVYPEPSAPDYVPYRLCCIAKPVFKNQGQTE